MNREKKLLARGIEKAVRTRIFQGIDIHYCQPELLVKMLLDELNERSTLFVEGRKKRCSDYLWYLTYEGRLGIVKRGDRACNAEKMLKRKKITKDDHGIYRATEILNGCGCQEVRHRPYIEALSKGKWADWVVEALVKYLDGGKELDYVIDTNFYDAYEPCYNVNTHIDDLVCSYSCMSERGDDAQAFYGAIEGCKVMRFFNENGKDVGRCLLYEYGGIRHFIRIYCYEDYQKDCLYTLRKQMREGDLFGRSEAIEGMRLPTSFDSGTPNMYLDGDRYGFEVSDGRVYISTNYVWSGDSTSCGALCEQAEDLLTLCNQCGRWISPEDDGEVICYDGYYYCDGECASEHGLACCDECGEYFDAESGVSTEDGNIYCSRRCARNAGYVCTESDGVWILEEEAFSPNGCEYYVDEEDAMNSGWHKCVECGEWTQMVHECTDGKPRCPNCLVNYGWVLKYVKESTDDEKTETSND